MIKVQLMAGIFVLPFYKLLYDPLEEYQYHCRLVLKQIIIEMIYPWLQWLASKDIQMLLERVRDFELKLLKSNFIKGEMLYIMCKDTEENEKKK
jgi:hypothetical protein